MRRACDRVFVRACPRPEVPAADVWFCVMWLALDSAGFLVTCMCQSVSLLDHAVNGTVKVPTSCRNNASSCRPCLEGSLSAHSDMVASSRVLLKRQVPPPCQHRGWQSSEDSRAHLCRLQQLHLESHRDLQGPWQSADQAEGPRGRCACSCWPAQSADTSALARTEPRAPALMACITL